MTYNNSREHGLQRAKDSIASAVAKFLESGYVLGTKKADFDHLLPSGLRADALLQSPNPRIHCRRIRLPIAGGYDVIVPTQLGVEEAFKNDKNFCQKHQSKWEAIPNKVKEQLSTLWELRNNPDLSFVLNLMVTKNGQNEGQLRRGFTTLDMNDNHFREGIELSPYQIQRKLKQLCKLGLLEKRKYRSGNTWYTNSVVTPERPVAYLFTPSALEITEFLTRLSLLYTADQAFPLKTFPLTPGNTSTQALQHLTKPLKEITYDTSDPIARRHFEMLYNRAVAEFYACDAQTQQSANLIVERFKAEFNK